MEQDIAGDLGNIVPIDAEEQVLPLQPPAQRVHAGSRRGGAGVADHGLDRRIEFSAFAFSVYCDGIGKIIDLDVIVISVRGSGNRIALRVSLPFRLWLGIGLFCGLRARFGRRLGCGFRCWLRRRLGRRFERRLRRRLEGRLPFVCRDFRNWKFSFGDRRGTIQSRNRRKDQHQQDPNGDQAFHGRGSFISC